MTLLERAHAYAAASPVAVSGSDGSGATFRLACSLVNGFALDERAALEVLQQWNTGCMPPWMDKDLRHKVEDALKANHQKPRGHLLGGQSGESKVHRWPDAPPAKHTTWKVSRAAVSMSSLAVQFSAAAAPHPFQDAETLLRGAADAGLIAVPGCRVPRPVEIHMADDQWRKLEASGFAEEPMVQLAVWMFGPGCRVIERQTLCPSNTQAYPQILQNRNDTPPMPAKDAEPAKTPSDCV